MENPPLIQSYGNWSRLEPIKVISIMPMPTIENFVASVKGGVEAWENAGKILVTLRNEDKDVFKKITGQYPFITEDSLEVFYHIGTRTLYPLALLLPRHVFNALREMTYEKQVEVCQKPIDIVSRLSGDKPVIIRKAIAKMSSDEVRRALWRKGNRSVENQVKQLTAPTFAPIQDRLPKPIPANVTRSPVSKGLFVIRRGIGGLFIFEATKARPYNTQQIRLEDGQAVIELTEFKKT